MNWAKAVWYENGKETEDTIPGNWVDVRKGVVFWPPKTVPVTQQIKLFNARASPRDNWQSFKLKKVKHESDVKKKCQDYDFTTTVESESEDEVQGARRTKAGKGLDPDFVTGGDLTSEEEEEEVQPYTPKKGKGIGKNSLGKEANLKPYPKPPLSGSLDKTPTSHTASRKRKASTPDAGVLKVRRNIQAELNSHQSPGTPAGATNYSPQTSQTPQTPRTPQAQQTSRTIRTPQTQQTSRTIRTPQTSRTPRTPRPQTQQTSRTVRTPQTSRTSKTLQTSRRSRTPLSPRRSPRRPNTGSAGSIRSRNQMEFPMEQGRFQRHVFNMLFDIREDIKRIRMSEAADSAYHIKTIDDVDEAIRQNEKLRDSQERNLLVSQLSKVGGKNWKDCTRKVLDRLFTNRLMTEMNLMGNGAKFGLAKNLPRLLEAIIEGVQKWAAIHKVPRVMDVEIRGEVGEHLKHARRREKTKNRQN